MITTGDYNDFIYIRLIPHPNTHTHTHRDKMVAKLQTMIYAQFRQSKLVKFENWNIFLGGDWWQVIICVDNYLAPNRRQAIIKTQCWPSSVTHTWGDESRSCVCLSFTPCRNSRESGACSLHQYMLQGWHDDLSWYGLSQWETTLHCNVVSTHTRNDPCWYKKNKRDKNKTSLCFIMFRL